ncbi:MAG: twin-arginine translocase subunit TatC [Chloroflexi bacterium]|nr:twin-arginine translocase subunit TatC [Chloroflexota bacterium]
MRKFFSQVWRVITFPFRLIFNIIAFPFRKIRQFHRFLNTEPDEHPLGEVFIDLTQNADTRQMMWEQVDDLRKHLLRALIVLILAVSASFFFTQQIIEFLAMPIGGLKAMVAIDPTESIGVFMKVAIFAGISLAIPYIAFEMWWFAAPGLRPHERKMGLAGIPLTFIFFIGGAAFTFFIMLPAAMPFLTSVLGIKTELRPQSYFSFVTQLMFWIGLSFEFPLVIYVLSAIGFVKPKILATQWRLAIVVIAIVAAIITPTPDFFNQGLVMLPLIFLYFLSIGLSYIAYAGRKRKQVEEEKKAAEAEMETF